MKFYRKTQGAVIGGVCLGLSQELNIDPLLIRLAALILFFVSAGLVGLIYLLLWAVLPAEDSNTTIKEELMDKINSLDFLKNKVQNPLMIGIVLIGIGLILFINYIIPMKFIMQILFPILLVGVGIYLIVKNKQ